MAAADINPQLRTDLNAALGVLAPLINGLTQLMLTGVSADLEATLSVYKTELVSRQSLVQAVLADLDQAVVDMTALESDGYPNMPPVAINAAAGTELAAELTDIQLAVAVFTPANVAFNSSAPITDVPQPVPTQ